MLVGLTPASALAGLYHAQQMAVGAALELKKNGHLRYQLTVAQTKNRRKVIGRWPERPFA